MGTVELGGQIYQFTAPSTNYRYLPVAVINCLVFAWMEFAPKAGPVSPPRMRTMEKPVAAAIMRVQSALRAAADEAGALNPRPGRLEAVARLGERQRDPLHDRA